MLWRPTPMPNRGKVRLPRRSRWPPRSATCSRRGGTRARKPVRLTTFTTMTRQRWTRKRRQAMTARYSLRGKFLPGLSLGNPAMFMKCCDGIWVRFARRCLAPISCLLSFISPAAVLFAIWSIIVDSVERVLRARLRPHIGKEAAEVIKPFLTNRYSTCSVRRIFRIIGVCASLLHRCPGLIFRCMAHSMRKMTHLSAFRTGHTHRFAARCEIRLRRFCVASAITLAQPSPAVMLVTQLRKHSQSSEAKPFELLWFWSHAVTIAISAMTRNTFTAGEVVA